MSHEILVEIKSAGTGGLAIFLPAETSHPPEDLINGSSRAIWAGTSKLSIITLLARTKPSWQARNALSIV